MEERQLQGKFTRIPNNLIKGDMELDSKELSVLILLYMSRNSKDVCIFNLEWLYQALGIKSNNTNGKKQIREILKGFYEDEILYYYKDIYLEQEYNINNIVTDYDKNELIFAELYQEIGDSQFTMLLDKEINLIINYSSENKIDTYSLLKTYAYICSTFGSNKQNDDYCLGYPSIINISERVDIAEKTTLKYINILNDLNIFIFDYAGFTETSKGQIRNGTMYYCRVGNEDLLLQKLNNERVTKGYIKINRRNKDKSNLKRSITQQINKIKKKEEKGQANIIELEKLKLLTEQYEQLTKQKEEKKTNEKA